MPTAIITGASRGIGRALAEEFAGAGYDLIVNCRCRFDQLDALAKRLSAENNIRCETVHGPIDAAALAGAFAALRRKAPGEAGRLAEENPASFSSGVDEADRMQAPGELVLINNAGISKLGLLQDMTDEAWEELLDANLTGMFKACRAVLPFMLHAHSGRIVNISSVWGEVGASCEVGYSATKGGINAFTRALAKELAPSGIAVNALACGAVDTDMNAWLSPEDRAALEEEIPAGRMARPQEVAAFVRNLAVSPTYLTGQVIRFDGGWI